MTGIGRRDVACGIAGGDRRTHIAVRGQHRSRNVHAPGFTVGIDGGLVGLGTDFDGNRVAYFDFIADFTGHDNRLTGLGCIDDVIGRDVINRNRGRRRDGIDTVSVAGIRRGRIARGISGGDRRTHITIGGQHRSRNIDDPGLTIAIHRRLVGLGTDFNGNRITRFNIVIDFTGDRDGLAGFSSINHVIRRDIIDRDRGRWRDGIHAVSMSRIRGGHITCGIARGHGRTHITVCSKHRTRNIDAPGLTIGIHRRLVRLSTDFHRDRITGFHVVIDFTGHRNRLTGLTGVNHVI